MIANRRLQEALGVGGERGGDHLQARDVGVEVLHGVTMLAPDLPRARVRTAKDDGAIELPAGHLPELRCVVEDLVEGHRAEVPGHKLDDRPQAHHRRADPDARESGLGDRRVDDPLRAEFLEHALADFVRALVVADLLTHEKDAIVAVHLFDHGLSEGFSVTEGVRHRDLVSLVLP
jgi:hypothetical protein